MIVFSAVSKQFLPDSYALKDISFEILPGELVLFTGPSGSGKTTLMKLLTKEYAPTNGDISFHETDLNKITNAKIHEHRRKIGVVFQDYKLIPELNIWENIALPLSIIGKNESEIEQRVTDLLELVSLSDKAMHFPKQLSGGEAQRISIARALSTGPSVIFADEPTGNLDRENSLLIAKLLEKINSLGTTVLFATHDHDVLDLMKTHRHIVLENGKINKDTGEKKKDPSVKKVDKKTEEKNEKIKVVEKESNTTNESSKETKEEKPVDTKKADVKEKPKTLNEEVKTTETEQSETIKPKKPGFFSRLFGKKKDQSKEKETEKQATKKKKISLTKTEDLTDLMEQDTEKKQTTPKPKKTKNKKKKKVTKK